MLALLAILLLSQSDDCARTGERCRGARGGRGGGTRYAFFEFAPLSGAGMGSACACATPTGAKGEAMTFSRGSSGTCLKTVGASPQAIANSDMVTCSSNQARVMPGADGTNVNGLLVEGTRTNSTTRSQQFDNATWQSENSGVAAPVVTADVAVAPDGTMTADRLQVPATTGANYSHIYSNSACPSATETASLFIRAHDGVSSGTLDLEVQGGTQVCTPCTYVGTAWTRCTLLSASTNSLMTIGSSKVYSGCSGAAADVDIWGAQCEVGSYATSYIATTSATVARSADYADFAAPTKFAGTVFSLAATSIVPHAVTSGWTVLNAQISDQAVGAAADGTNYIWTYPTTLASSVASTGYLTANYTTGPNITLDAVNRVATYYDGTTLTTCVGGTCGAGAAASPTGSVAWTRLRIASVNTTGATESHLGGVVKRVCLDPLPSRCR